METVRPICADVAHRGAEALRELGERLDGIRPASLRVPGQAMAQALDWLDPDVRAALAESIRRARLVHADQRRPDVTTHLAAGGTVTERRIPVARVGLYVPGGLAVYPSSRGHERRARPGGRGRLARGREPATEGAGPVPGPATPVDPGRRARCSASRRCTRSAALRPSRCSLTAPQKRTARWCARPSIW